jgi:hypothetical protein
MLILRQFDKIKGTSLMAEQLPPVQTINPADEAARLRVAHAQAAEHVTEVEQKWDSRIATLQTKDKMPVGRSASIGDTAIAPFVEGAALVGKLRAYRRANKAEDAFEQHYEQHEGAIQEDALEEAKGAGVDVKGWTAESKETDTH